jgi:hypothetical protein
VASKSRIEVFIGGCKLCDRAVALVNDVVDPAEADIEVLSIDGPEAQAYGLKAVPSIVKDGQLVFAGLPTEEEARAKLAS